MMTKEEVTAIEEYCRENNTSCRKRIAELDISEWKFYQAKRRFSKPEDANGSGGFLQLLHDGNTGHGQCRCGMPASDIQQTTETGTQPMPSQVYIRRIIRHKLVLKSNMQVEDPDRKVFALAPVPPMPLPKCMASESMLADILVEKFMYHMAFYRVIQRYR